MSDSEMTTVVLNALLEEWGNFTSSIYGKNESTPFQDLWSLCKIEESRLKAKPYVGTCEKNQAGLSMFTHYWASLGLIVEESFAALWD